MSKALNIVRTAVSVAVVVVVIGAGILLFPKLRAWLAKPALEAAGHRSPLFEPVHDKRDTLRISPEALAAIDLQTIEVKQAPPPNPLRLPGSLGIDPNRLVAVHSRFAGEIQWIATVEVDVNDLMRELHENESRVRMIRYGDMVTEGQVLATVWSRDIGEKKSELVDALSKLELDRKLLERLRALPKQLYPKRQLYEAERAVDADWIAAVRAERTLRAWKLTPHEIDAVTREASALRERWKLEDDDMDPEEREAATEHLRVSEAKTGAGWAEYEVRAPMGGFLVEKSVNVGTMVDTDDDLFKIADLSRIMVLAYVYEEDLPQLARLSDDERVWDIDLKADPTDKPRRGRFTLIGPIIDVNMHTGALIGWLENDEMTKNDVGKLNGDSEKLRPGQFITATIRLPADPDMVAVPATALIEEGNADAVFVVSSHEPYEVTRRQVAVTRRGKEHVFIRAQPDQRERAEGAQPLSVGEEVVKSGGLELDAELTGLQSTGDDTGGGAD